MAVLTKLLEEQITRLRSYLSQAVNNSNSLAADNPELEALFEDIHWVLLTAGEHYSNCFLLNIFFRDVE